VQAVLDVWEQQPMVSVSADRCRLATAAMSRVNSLTWQIARYSGRSIQALCALFGVSQKQHKGLISWHQQMVWPLGPWRSP